MVKVNVSFWTEVGYLTGTRNVKTSLQTVSLLNCVCQLYMLSVGQAAVHIELSHWKILIRSTAVQNRESVWADISYTRLWVRAGLKTCQIKNEDLTITGT
jgi:hypothetical protein